MLKTPICVVTITLLMSIASLADDEWPQFRGPDGQGHAQSADLPLKWSESENIVWKAAIPGEGHSSPVISGSQIWLTTAIVQELTEEQAAERLSKIRNPNSLKIAGTLLLKAICLDRNSGTVKHEVDLFTIAEPEPKHSLNSYASPTPVIAGNMLICHFGTYGTAGVNRESGQVVWRVEQLRLDHQNGPGSSPVVWDDLAIIHLDGMDTQSVAALRTTTGELVWQTTRSGEMDPTPELKKAYGTPLIVETDQRPVVISPAANWVYGYDARNGREIWKAAYGKLGFSTVPRPVLFRNKAIIATSYMQSRLLAVRIDGEGDVTNSHVEWISDRQIPQKPSAVIAKDLLFFVSDRGIARCLQPESGEEVWFARLPGEYSASPTAAGDRLYFFNHDGTCTVIRAGQKFEQLAQNQLASGVMASPAIAGNSLFIRTQESLYRIEEK